MYIITDKCRFCDTCIALCPAGAVKKTYPYYSIDQSCCLECGKCRENCSFEAIELVE